MGIGNNKLSIIILKGLGPAWKTNHVMGNLIVNLKSHAWSTLVYTLCYTWANSGSFTSAL